MANAADTNQMKYNNPHWAVSGGNVVQADQSTIGAQIKLDAMLRKALIESEDERFFTQLKNDSVTLPKNSGKTLKQYRYLPLLSDANVGNSGIDAEGNAISNQNLMGDSTDMNIVGLKAPALTEVGGRVNRVGFHRTVVEAKLDSQGFFYEFTQDALDFDSDPEMLMHMSREAIRGAQKIQELTLGRELVLGAGQTRYTGAATSIATTTGEGNTKSLISYKDLQAMAVSLKKAKAPNKLKAIKGSRLIDTKIIGSAYPLYVHIDLENHFREMKDAGGEKVFIPVEKYAQAGNTLNGEIGSVGQFRIVVHPDMVKMEGAGAEDVGKDSDYMTSAGKAVANGGYGANTDTAKNYYDVYPVLAVAPEAFATVSFAGEASGGTTNGMKLITKLPGADSATTIDPYGKSGFTSIQWNHGTLIGFPEWIVVAHTICPL